MKMRARHPLDVYHISKYYSRPLEMLFNNAKQTAKQLVRKLGIVSLKVHL